MDEKTTVRNEQLRKDTQEVVVLIPALRAFARKFCRHPADADDLVQETLLKAIANIESYQHGTRLKSWLFTIMRNTFYNRAIIARREAPGATDCAALRPTMAPTQEWSVRSIELRNAIDRLPEPQKEVVLLVGLMGTSYKDAAEKCNCNIGTIKSRLNRSRMALMSELGEASERYLRTRAHLKGVCRPAITELSEFSAAWTCIRPHLTSHPAQVTIK